MRLFRALERLGATRLARELRVERATIAALLGGGANRAIAEIAMRELIRVEGELADYDARLLGKQASRG